MGVNDHDNQIHIIDFGLVKIYRDPKTCLHIPYKSNCNLMGTTSYALINNHLGVVQSRCDDLESIAYVLLFFIRGSLPWVAKPAGNKQQWDTTLQTKLNTPIDILCSTCPVEFGIFLGYTRALRFEDKPDYTYIHKLFCDLFVREGYHHGHPFTGYVIGNSTDKQSTIIRAGTKNIGRQVPESGRQLTSGRI